MESHRKDDTQSLDDGAEAVIGQRGHLLTLPNT